MPLQSTTSWVVVPLSLLAACAQAPPLDQDVRAALDAADITPLDFGPTPERAQAALGEALFFDKELSGNRDVACATCHHPTLGTGDGLSLPIGTGGHGLGPERELGDALGFVPRNAPEIFNRGAPAWTSMFWDSRVATTPYEVASPAGAGLPGEITDALAGQALFPPTSPDEMRGHPGDLDVFGAPNELAVLPADDPAGIWDALMQRLLAIDAYGPLFEAAYPDVAEPGFEHAAMAMAAYEVDAFTFPDSPWDRYVAGDDDALSDAAKRGALLFFGDAGCADCHSGNLLTDQEHHNLCVPQLGPGKGDEAPEDHGRARETGAEADRFAFRTPPLRNVTLTGPWMHDGAYTNLRAAVAHHLDPSAAMATYDTDQLDARLADAVLDDEAFLSAVTETVDWRVAEPTTLSSAQLDDLMALLDAFTDPAVEDLSALVPDTVPSGLPVD